MRYAGKKLLLGAALAAVVRFVQPATVAKADEIPPPRLLYRCGDIELHYVYRATYVSTHRVLDPVFFFRRSLVQYPTQWQIQDGLARWEAILNVSSGYSGQTQLYHVSLLTGDPATLTIRRGGAEGPVEAVRECTDR